MPTTISLRAPTSAPVRDLASSFVESVARGAGLNQEDEDALERATAAVVDFALAHAYAPGSDGELLVEAHLFDGGVRVDVHDWGLPLELQRDRTAAGAHVHAALELPGLGLDGLVDEASFQNLGRDGKLFSIVKHCAYAAAAAPTGLSDHDDHETPATAADVTVRTFQPGDEEGICQLVYRNYAHTYGAEFFYIPEKLLERNESGEVRSTVALLGEEVVGHHALLREEEGPLAETGAAVVHPERKGLGIFNAMSLVTLEGARELGLSAVYAQNVSLHPYSQKAAYTHGYRTTAIQIGRARASVRLEGNELSRTGKRHAIVLAHLSFDPQPRRLHLPQIYRERILETYAYCGIEVSDGGSASEGTPITAELDAGLNVGTITVGRFEDGDEAELARAFHYLLAKHADMIYADLDLETLERVDDVVALLNGLGFFYSGILLLRRDGHDHLRLQYENTVDADEDEIVCYSEFSQGLREYVLADRRRVAPD